MSSVVTHPTYPIKSVAGIIHMRQTIAQLRPFKMDERITKRGIIEGGTNTERGTELDAIVELYTSPNMKPDELIARGVSSFLIVKKKRKFP